MAVVVCLPAVITAVRPSDAWAKPPVECSAWIGPCDVRAGTPGRPGQNSDGGDEEQRPNRRERDCRDDASGKKVPCASPEFGTWNPDSGCYEKLASPQPPKSNPVWQGHTDGVIVQSVCPGVPGTGGGWQWRPSAPDANASVTPAELAQRAVEQLPIRGPDIRMAPRRGATGLVGLPVWMWTRRTSSTWGPASETASVPGMSVTATARGERIVWHMGDDAKVTCRGPGTAYRERFGNRMSPTCGYRYAQSSADEPDGVYRVTARTTWRVDWFGGGDAGTIRVTRSSSTTVRIGEMQVLIQPHTGDG